MFCKAQKGRRPYSISVGQRPMKSGQARQCKAESLEAVFYFGFRPFRALHSRVFPFYRALPDANAKRLSTFSNALKEELDGFLVVRNFRTTAADGKTYQMEHYKRIDAKRKPIGFLAGK